MMDTWVKRSDHVRLQNIRVGYKLPETLMHTLGIRSATVALEGRNLFVFGANYKNFLDPETMSNQFAQPIPKSFTYFNLAEKYLYTEFSVVLGKSYEDTKEYKTTVCLALYSGFIQL